MNRLIAYNLLYICLCLQLTETTCLGEEGRIQVFHSTNTSGLMFAIHATGVSRRSTFSCTVLADCRRGSSLYNLKTLNSEGRLQYRTNHPLDALSIH